MLPVGLVALVVILASSRASVVSDTLHIDNVPDNEQKEK
jgi:hypothetical protein